MIVASTSTAATRVPNTMSKTNNATGKAFSSAALVSCVVIWLNAALAAGPPVI